MKITITFRHLQPTAAIKDFVNEKLERLERYGAKEKEAHVILDLERYLQKAEIIVTTKGVKASAKASTEDMYGSIDEAIAKVEKILKRSHDKKIRAKNHPREIEL